ncbi:hypothetical protein KIW84_UN0753 [Lathyrus oleraceus]|nr:hypothetical protein KIW84_UN0753 [Pisum sativum]
MLEVVGGERYSNSELSSYRGVFLVISTCHYGVNANEITSKLVIDAGSGRLIPDTFFGAFFEEINHAGAGGLWAELVNNRGFEAEGSINGTSNIYPWTIIGENQSSIIVSTERSSCFERNKIALRMDVLCHRKSCPRGGVGISNPGFGECWSMGERPGHYNDIWKYWTDDGFGYFEGLQEALDGIEFARGSPESKWGSLRASMGHPKSFDLRYVGVGNEDCGKHNYQGNYLEFYKAIKDRYPDIQIISNCDGSQYPLNHPADLYDFHIYTNSKDMFSQYTKFDKAPRSGPKAYVSEYAVWKEDAGNGSLYAAVAEAAFLMGLEKNSWIPDAIVFNTYQNYGTPSYWLQQFFIDSNGAIFLNSTLYNSSSSIVASAIQYTNLKMGKLSKSQGVFLVISTCHYGVNANEITSKLVIDAGSGRLIPDTFFGAFFEEINHAGAGGLWAELVNNRGGCYVEGDYLKYAFRWKDTVGAWEERPGHYNDIWKYWTDDGFGYFEGLQEALDGIEFARGSPESKWGSLRASMGHPKSFDLRYVGVGNEDCDYTNSKDMFSQYTKFDKAPRSGPKAYVSEYAVWKEDAGNGSLYAAVAEAAFLIGLEKNRNCMSGLGNFMERGLIDCKDACVKGVHHMFIDEACICNKDLECEIYDLVSDDKFSPLNIFHEINHAGAGGLWAELVNNRGFEAEGSINGTSNIYPWTIIGENQSSIIVSTERSSCFERNKIALRMDVLCHRKSCPRGGVGISNPGFWGMNIEEGKKYKVVFYVRSLGRINLQISFVGSDNGVNLSSTKIRWKDTVGAWEERPGHYNDIWKYWTDDGFGYFEGLQEALDGIEFARGSPESKWGSLRASMGHPKSFDLRYVGVGNEIVIYTNSKDMFSQYTKFDKAPRSGPKHMLVSMLFGRKMQAMEAFMPVAEAAFLIGLEKNSDVVSMVAYAPLFVNTNDK